MPSAAGIRAGAAYIELYTKDNALVRGLDQASKRLRAFGDGILAIGKRMAIFGAALTTPLLGASKMFADMGSDLIDMSQRTGVSVESLSELGFAAEQSGADLETLESSLKKLQKFLVQAASGSRSAQEALAHLGLTTEDLVQLAPDKQFVLLADRISKIENPALRTATAMELFGKSGTRLLPLISAGALGIEELVRQARDLGLTMSSEDAQAAEAFGDAMDRLWKVLRKTVFTIGAALEPVLSQILEIITQVVAASSKWISQNKSLVVLLAKIAITVVAVGVALVTLGATVSAVGTILASLATTVAGAGSAIAMLAALVAALLTPLGLASVGIASLGVVLLYVTGAGSKALTWLGDRFGELAQTAQETWQGIGDALATGDIALAGEILWLTLKVQWQKGIHFLQSQWLSFSGYFVGVFQDAVFGIARLMTEAWAGLRAGWIETTSFLADSWSVLMATLKTGWNYFGGFFQKVFIRIRSLFKDIDAEAEIAKVNAEVDQQQQQIIDQRNARIGSSDQQRQQQLSAVEQDRQGARSQLDQMQSQQQSALDASLSSSLAQSEAELASAQKRWQDALELARKRRLATSEKPSSATLRQLASPDGLDNLLADTQKRVDIAGTFNALATSGLGADSLSERTAKATEQIANNTRRLLQEVQLGGAAFE